MAVQGIHGQGDAGSGRGAEVGAPPTEVAAQDLAGPFLEAMSRLACGVVTVTTLVDGKPWGVTVSACCSVSMDPPLLLVVLNGRARSVESIRERGHFGVSLLGANSVEIARFGSAPGQPKFMPHLCDEPVDEHPLASPGVAGALAHVECIVDREIDAGDHVVFIGAVRKVSGVSSRAVWDSPLVYYRREYHVVSELHDAFSR